MLTISVGEEVTVFTAQALWTQWQPLLADNSSVCFDCRDLTEFDSCGAQLFYFIVARYSQEVKTTIVFSHCPDDIRDDLEALNMQGIISDQAQGED